MAELPQSIIIGSWRMVRSEPPLKWDFVDERILHFTPDYFHYWEHPFAIGLIPPLCRFTYRMTERGVFITPKAQAKGWELPLHQEGTFLVITGAGERDWWIERILPGERPDYLTHYYAPPNDLPVA